MALPLPPHAGECVTAADTSGSGMPWISSDGRGELLMTFGGRHFVIASAMSLVLLGPQPVFAGVQAKFGLDSPASGPFPSDRFTIADPSQNTQRRVDLPIPDCAVRQSDCEDLAVINTLDGFHKIGRASCRERV